MIRITNKMMTNTLKANMYVNTNKLNNLQNELATSRRINQPSDDPGGLVKSLRLRSNITENDQYISNIEDATSLMDTADSALGNLSQVLSRVRELTVEAANGTNDSSALQSITDEIKQLSDQVKTIANSTYGSKYIFAGSNVTQPPCTSNGWTGNSNALQREIGSGVQLQVNVDMKAWFVGTSISDAGASTGPIVGTANSFNIQVDGDLTPQPITLTNGISGGANIAADMETKIRALGGNYSKVTVSYVNNRYEVSSGNTDPRSTVTITAAAANDASASLKIGTSNGGTETEGIFSVFDQLQTSVSSGNSATTNTLLGTLDTKIDSLLTDRAVVGAKVNRLELQQSRLESSDTSLTGLLSKVEDADMTEVSLELKTQENVYNATLAAGAQIIQPSLISFLK